MSGEELHTEACIKAKENVKIHIERVTSLSETLDANVSKGFDNIIYETDKTASRTTARVLEVLADHGDKRASSHESNGRVKCVDTDVVVHRERSLRRVWG